MLLLMKHIIDIILLIVFAIIIFKGLFSLPVAIFFAISLILVRDIEQKYKEAKLLRDIDRSVYKFIWIQLILNFLLLVLSFYRLYITAIGRIYIIIFLSVISLYWLISKKWGYVKKN